MSKHDVDNRANQLNPNNSAYASSRGLGRGYDDDDECVAAVSTPPNVHISEPRPGTVEDFGTSVVRFVTDELPHHYGSVKVLVRRGEDITKELANLWSSDKFLHLSCHQAGVDFLTGDRVEELTNPTELEQAREALANSIGKSNRDSRRAEAAAFCFKLSHRACSLRDLASYPF